MKVLGSSHRPEDEFPVMTSSPVPYADVPHRSKQCTIFRQMQKKPARPWQRAILEEGENTFAVVLLRVDRLDHTVAVGLAQSLLSEGNGGEGKTGRTLFIDCDVEAPDAHLFLHPRLDSSVEATIPVPVIDSDTCIACGDCSEVCRFNAIAVLTDGAMVFPELCHGCGSCSLICPTRSVVEQPRAIGTLQAGSSGGLDFAQGKVNVGEPLAVPVIKQLKTWASRGDRGITILDSPPGTSCPMVETVSGADFVILVTEPTPSGVHDLELADRVLWEMGIPGGVIVNRDGLGYPELEETCAMSRLPLLLRLPFDRGVAEGMARGDTLLDIRPEYRGAFRRLLEDICRVIGSRGDGREREDGLMAHLGIRQDLEFLRRGGRP